MKDVPAFVWIFGIFILSALGIGLYATLGSGKLLTPQSAWESVERLRNDLETRRLMISPGGRQDVAVPPYHIELMRLEDTNFPEHVARYLIHLSPLGRIPMERPW